MQAMVASSTMTPGSIIEQSENSQSIQHQFMKLVFKALCSRNYPNPCFRSLPIRNLSDFYDTPFTASLKFKNLFSRLNELHLHMG